ncbi:MAG: hypothetical protein P8X95_06395 [Anaerolineales bacterium]|jgi:hypothetical protein
MFTGPWIEELSRTYREDHLRRSETVWLLEQAKRANRTPSPQVRLLSQGGDLLIAFGQWLKQRSGPGFETPPVLRPARLDGSPCEQ